MLKSVRKTENGGYKTMTDAASTYVLCPRLWNQVSVNFRARKTMRVTENKARMYRLLSITNWSFAEAQEFLIYRNTEINRY